MNTFPWPVLLIDHHDSFTHTINAYFETLGCLTRVVTYDDGSLPERLASQQHVVVLSPGPGHPRDVACTLALIRAHYRTVPMLGVCLGMQCMAEALGGRVTRANVIMHGKQSLIEHRQQGLFEAIPNRFSATRYHSWVVDARAMPPCLQVTAWVEDGDIMAFMHEKYPLFGVQYHPEAVLTEHGYTLLHHFLMAAQRWLEASHKQNNPVQV